MEKTIDRYLRLRSEGGLADSYFTESELYELVRAGEEPESECDLQELLEFAYSRCPDNMGFLLRYLDYMFYRKFPAEKIREYLEIMYSASDVSEQPLFYFYKARYLLLCGRTDAAEDNFMKAVGMLGLELSSDEYEGGEYGSYDYDDYNDQDEDMQSAEEQDPWFDDVYSDPEGNIVTMYMSFAADLAEKGLDNVALAYYYEAYVRNRRLDRDYNYLLDRTVSILSDIAGCYQRTGRLEDAVKVIEVLLDFSPNDAWAWNQLGELYNLRGMYSSAVESLSMARCIYPEYDAANRNMAFARLFMEDYVDAVDEFEKYLSSCPDDNSSKLALVEAYIGMRNMKEAERVLSTIPENFIRENRNGLSV